MYKSNYSSMTKVSRLQVQLAQIVSFLLLLNIQVAIAVTVNDSRPLFREKQHRETLCCQSMAKLPTVIVKDVDWSQVLNGDNVDESGQNFYLDGITGVTIHLECTAPYPVQFIYEPNEKAQLTSARSGPNWSKVFYSDFFNKSTYTFYTHQELTFVSVTKSQTFTCESVENPCLQQSVIYSYIKESYQLNFTMVKASNNAGKMVVHEKQSENDQAHCDAHYYYEKVGTDSYTFRCEFEDGRPGEIKQYPCGNQAACSRILRNRPLQKNCWKAFNSTAGEECKNCKARPGLGNFISTVTVCANGPLVKLISSGPSQSWSSLKDYEETEGGTLVLYELTVESPRMELPEIYFSNEDALKDPSKLIKLGDFPPDQVLGSNLTIECFASGYFTAAAMQFALEYEGQAKLELLPALSDKVQWNDPSSSRSARIAIYLNRTDLKRIHCFAAIENTFNWLNASRPIKVQELKILDSQKNDTKATLIVEIIAPIIIICGTVVAVLIVRIKKLRKELRNLTDEEVRAFIHGCDYGNYVHVPGTDENYIRANPLYSGPFDTKFELPRNQLELDESCVLGSGQFGVVMKGTLKRDKNEEPLTVAVKTVRPNVDVDTFKALLSEIKIMSCLGQHENIVGFLGACTRKIREREIFAAIEFCSNGDLRSYLREQRKSFPNLSSLDGSPSSPAVMFCGYVQLKQISQLELLEIAKGMANGMKFLTTKNVIHGDLACRNILLNDKMEVKISDFGLSKQLLQYSKYVKKQEIPLPYKWMAPETLVNMEFSIKSDVWSFGVCLMEIFSLGDDPYPGHLWSGDFIELLRSGYRMKQPELASQQIYELMLECWNLESRLRPTFDDIYSRILHQMTLAGGPNLTPSFF